MEIHLKKLGIGPYMIRSRSRYQIVDVSHMIDKTITPLSRVFKGNEIHGIKLKKDLNFIIRPENGKVEIRKVRYHAGTHQIKQNY